MKEYFEQIFDLPRSRKISLLWGGVAFLLVLYGLLLYWPRSQQLAQLQQRIDQLLQQRDRLSAQTSEVQKARQDIRELDATFAQAMAQLPDQKEIPDLLSNVSSLGRESGLEIILFRQRPEVYEEFYARVPVEMQVKGYYHQVAVFFDKVGQLSRIVNVTDINMKNPRVVDGNVELESAFSATTFRFLTEEERARIAAEKKSKK